MLVDTSVKIGKIKLQNPVMVASGTFGYAEEFKDLIDLKKLGAVITKSVTLNPRQGNIPPRIWETTAGMLNAIGLQNEGVEDFIRTKLPYLKNIGIPVVVSIAGEKIEEYGRLAGLLDIAGVAGVEVNISCPNVGSPRHQVTSHKLFAQDAKAAAAVTKVVKKNTKKTVIVKLSPDVADICEIAKAVEKAGADAISVINTIRGMAVDIETQKPRLGNITGGLSGPAIKPIALRIVWETAKAVEIPVIGIGGIMTGQDAIEFLLCGAQAVQIGTANFVNPRAAIAAAEGIERYLQRKGFTRVRDIVGKLSTTVAEP
ncbi:MAG: dihydroorotate dehydrogenase [Candidatus Omnitrophota bacterium]